MADPKESKMPARKPRPDEKPQSERFIETAREIGADETLEAFEQVFKRLVHPKKGKAAHASVRRSESDSKKSRV